MGGQSRAACALPRCPGRALPVRVRPACTWSMSPAPAGRSPPAEAGDVCVRERAAPAGWAVQTRAACALPEARARRLRQHPYGRFEGCCERYYYTRADLRNLGTRLLACWARHATRGRRSLRRARVGHFFVGLEEFLLGFGQRALEPSRATAARSHDVGLVLHGAALVMYLSQALESESSRCTGGLGLGRFRTHYLLCHISRPLRAYPNRSGLENLQPY